MEKGWLKQRTNKTFAQMAREADVSPATITLLNQGVWPKTAKVKEKLKSYLLELGIEFTGDSTGIAVPRAAITTKLSPEVDMLKPQTKKNFKLFSAPFNNDVQKADDVYLNQSLRYVKEAMYQTAINGGILAVIGESGSGKTTLRRDLFDRIRRETLPITAIMPATIDKTRLTAAAICDAIIADCSQEPTKRALEAKARQIQRILTGSSRGGNSHVLIIEEAHDLSMHTLKYLKRFWELEDGFKRLISIVLVGQPELKLKLSVNQNWEAREIVRRCEVAEIEPFTAKDIEAYLSLKFKRIGSDYYNIFGKDAAAAMAKKLILNQRGHEPISMAYPLIINSLAVKCLNFAADIGASIIDTDVVNGV